MDAMAAARSAKAERERVRESLFARGCTTAQVAVELVRRFRTRPRLAWRHALGWAQWKLVQEYLAANPEARLTESRVSEYESWPFGGVKPPMEYLAGLAVTFRCQITDLVDGADREHLTAAELLLVGEPQVSAAPVVLLVPLHDEWSARVTAAVADPARYCDAQVVSMLRTQLETFKAMDGRHGPAAALPGVLGVVSAVWAMAQEAPERMRVLLLSLAAEAAEFTGWLYRDLADPKRAGVWYDRAMEWAQAAGDRGAQGFLLIRKSQMAYDAYDGRRVLLLARTALDGPWKLDPWLRAEALVQAAKGQAMMGQSVQLNAVTDQAYPLAAGRERTLDLRVATAWSEAGEPERAAALYASALASGELSRRDMGFFGARRSSALARAGEPEPSAVQAIKALAEAREIGSARTGAIVRDTLTALRRWSRNPVVADLEAAVSSRP
ncbi:hypothetical protein [Promicromonospora sp. NFX87]|uniref:hypothetical protein n=1 Tax=Promicromonospora sp. NFX87 TaxID=3402691 RepID=UPI003AFA9669